MSEKELKLYIWADFETDYLGGLAFAIAEDETDARKQVVDKNEGFEIFRWGDLTVAPLNEKICHFVVGGM